MSSISLDAIRQAEQLAFSVGAGDLVVGSHAACPLPVHALSAVRGDEPFVVESFRGGLTAVVHRLHVAGRDWTLKLARTESLVRNVDGQTAFLNEVQRRADFEMLKAQPGGRERFASIADTTYASYRQGLMLSPWIDGEIVRQWDERRIAQVIDAVCACALEGLFEWDLSPGNVLDDGAQVRLFDFGYMYRFDPLRQFNSAGQGDDCPQFHPVERFETRNFFGVLLQLERERAEAALSLFDLEKRIALQAYRRYRSELAARGAEAAVLDRLDRISARWQRALRGESGGLPALYRAEGWHAHVIDLHDDLSGQSCTPMTLARADWLIDALAREFEVLTAEGALSGGDAGASLERLLAKYREYRAQAERLQVRSS